MLRGFHSGKLGIAEKDAAGEGKSIVCSSFWTVCPSYSFKFSWSFLDFRSWWYLERYEWLGMTCDEQTVLAWMPMDFYPPIFSPQTQVSPIAFLPQQPLFLLSHSCNPDILSHLQNPLQRAAGCSALLPALGAGWAASLCPWISQRRGKPNRNLPSLYCRLFLWWHLFGSSVSVRVPVKKTNKQTKNC